MIGMNRDDWKEILKEAKVHFRGFDAEAAEERARKLIQSWTVEKWPELPDIACKHCGLEIYCGDLSKICGPDCPRLKDDDA